MEIYQGLSNSGNIKYLDSNLQDKLNDMYANFIENSLDSDVDLDTDIRYDLKKINAYKICRRIETTRTSINNAIITIKINMDKDMNCFCSKQLLAQPVELSGTLESYPESGEQSKVGFTNPSTAIPTNATNMLLIIT